MTVFLLLAFAVIAARLFVLQIVRGAATRATADNVHSVYQTLLPSRGEIKIVDKFSSQTFPAATNRKSYLVYAVPGDILNATATAATLSEALAMPKNDILPKLSWTEKKYVPIKKDISEAEQAKIKQLKLPGVHLDWVETRYYPEQNLLSHVLGFVGYNKDNDKVGLYGLERYFETELAGKPGFISQEQGLGGALIFGGNRKSQPARDGENLVLTIDKNIQFKAETILKEAVTKNEADSGSAIVVNPKTGAILAMAGYPDFNPNEFNKVTDPQVYSNEATIGSYEPGSVFKAITMAAALDEGKVSPDSTYTDTGEVLVGKYRIQNSDHKAHGVQTMTQVLNESLNTGAIYALKQIGNADFLDYIKRFGFGKPTGVELPEAKGNLDNLKGNIETNYFTASFGQGISVTPIQMVQAYTALANGGKMMKPYIVQSVIGTDGKVKNTEPEVVSQVISQKASNQISAMLVDVVENGHGKKAGVPGYWIGGKTGTAQVPRRDGKPGYEENNNIGSFIGYGPIENPQFLMLVRINHPRNVNYAESTAAPAWGQLAQFILSYYQIPPSRTGK